jgi:hypothetical protein
MNSEQLNNILDHGEGQHVEFKSDFPEQAHKIAKSMVAFSNSGGGIILMGIEDDGTLIGIANPSKACDRLADIAKACNPPLCPKIDRIMITSDITVVYAEFSHSPISMYQDKVYVRVSATSRPASGKDIERLSRPSNLEYIQLEANLEQSYRISGQKLRKQALKGYSISIIGIFFLYFGLYISLFLAMPNFLLWIWNIAILLVIPIFFWYFIRPYFDEMYLYYKKPKKVHQCVFIGQGRFMEKNDVDSYLVYNPTADCIYPCCNEGKIIVADAPPREVHKLGKKYVGICSKTGKDHSYRIDSILVATKDNFDWRPLD